MTTRAYRPGLGAYDRQRLTTTVVAAARAARSAFERLLRPRSLAIVGASPEPFSLGGNVLDNVERFGFAGDLHLVSRTRTRSKAALASARSTICRTVVDAVVLVIPVQAVKDAIKACARRGVGGAVVFASGFGELGEEGRRAQNEMAALARTGGIALLGPNCLGAHQFRRSCSAHLRAGAAGMPAGPGVCAIAQSGAMAGNIRMALLSSNVPVAYTFSTGNEAVLAAEDVIAGLLDDPAVQLFSVFVEQIRHPKRFLALAAQSRRRGKPIVLMHPGPQRALARSRQIAHRRAGRRLCGDAHFRRARRRGSGREPRRTVRRQRAAGALSAPAGRRRRDHEQFRRVARFLARFLRTHRFAAARACPRATEADAETSAAGFRDYRQSARYHRARHAKAELVRRFGAGTAEATRKSAPCWSRPWAARRRSRWRNGNRCGPVCAPREKPVALAFLGDGAPLSAEFLADIKDSGVPFFRSPDRAMRAIAHMMRYGQSAGANGQRAALSLTVSRAADIPPDRWSNIAARQFFAEAGIPVPRGELARTLDDAVRIASTHRLSGRAQGAGRVADAQERCRRRCRRHRR